MLTFEMLETAFFGVLTVGLVVFMVGFSLGFLKINFKDTAVKPGAIVKLGCGIMALSLIPLLMTLFV